MLIGHEIGIQIKESQTDNKYIITTRCEEAWKNSIAKFKYTSPNEYNILIKTNINQLVQK